MSSLLHDSHLIRVACRGRDCNMDNRCVECKGWSEEVMIKYVRYRKSLDSKSKAKKEKKSSASSDQASLPSSRALVPNLGAMAPKGGHGILFWGP